MTKDINSTENNGILTILKEEFLKYPLKWLIMLNSCVITWGSYYIFDFPGAIGTGQHGTIQERFVSHNKTYNQADNLALYSIYSWPNVLLAILGGILIDKVFGLRKSLLLFSSLVAIGSGIMWWGVYTTNYWIILAGRFIFGCGGESLTVAQSALISLWFSPPQRGLSLAFASGVAFSRGAGSLDFYLTPTISNKYGVVYAFGLGFIFCIISVVFTFILMYLDYRGEKKADIRKPIEKETTSINIKSLIDLPLFVWIVGIIIAFIYSGIFPYVGFATNLFQVHYNYTELEAANTISLFQAASAFALPIAGIIIDSIGRHSYAIFLASCCLSLFQILSIFTTLPTTFMMIYLSIVYSILVASVWTTVPFIVSKSRVGLTYGMLTSIQNLGLAVTPLITGKILTAYTPVMNHTHSNNVTTDYLLQPIVSHNNTNSTVSPISHTNSINLPSFRGYQYALGVMFICTFISVIFSLILYILDMKRSGVLAASTSKKKIYDNNPYYSQDKSVNSNEYSTNNEETKHFI